MRTLFLLRHTALFMSVVGALVVSRFAFAQAPIAVIPQPVSVQRGAGEFTLLPGTVIWTDRATAAVGHALARSLEPATGFALTVRSGTGTSGSRIVLRVDPAITKSLGAEGYRLDVRPRDIVIRAADEAGAFYGAQTVLQLLPSDIFREAPVANVTWAIPAVQIADHPRFAWRGAHLDVSRHFMPVTFVKKFIDLMALHKLNRFHWHLTDDQGWRIEIKKYPLLTQVGGCRVETVVGRVHDDTTQNVYDGTPHCGFYTQGDIREIVAYAAARHVTVVPEIEMPGHAQAAIAAYPFLGNLPDSIRVRVWNRWGVNPNIFNPADTTVAFLKDVLAEVIALFPGPYIHVGGDEAVKVQWENSPVVQARIKALGLKNEGALQSWFMKQMGAFLTSHGRRLVGWDEILEEGLAPGAVVMSWRGIQGGIDASRAGHDVVMTPFHPLYFDQPQSRNPNEPLGGGSVNLIDSVYAYDPVPAALEPAFTKHVLGAQGQLWTEFMTTPLQVEYMAYPRMAALAEAVWTLKERKNFGDFMTRLQSHLPRLKALDVNYRAPRETDTARVP